MTKSNAVAKYRMVGRPIAAAAAVMQMPQVSKFIMDDSSGAIDVAAWLFPVGSAGGDPPSAREICACAVPSYDRPMHGPPLLL